MNTQRLLPLSLCALIIAAGCLSVPKAPVPSPPPTSAAAGATTVVAVAPPATAPPNVWQFLGLNVLCGDLAAKAKHVVACLGKYLPYLEPTPPLLPLVDPANLTSGIPAVATAAKVKAAEDAAPQKIKALQYLATIGCTGCYTGVEEAFLASLKDCTESVRFAAVNALLETSRNPCCMCNHSACCSPKILRALHAIAYETDPRSGCYLEPSARVRRVARLAMRGCGNVIPPPPVPSVPLEGPAPVPPGAAAPGPAPPIPAPPVPAPPVNAPVAAFEAIEQAAHTALLGGVENAAFAQRASKRFDPPSQVRWERITAAYADFETEELAREAIEYMRQRAKGIETDRPPGVDLMRVRTNTVDWTTRDAVSSQVIAQALFSLPVGQTSVVLTDSRGYHLVRVLERRREPTKPRSAAWEEAVERILGDRGKDDVSTIGTMD